MLRRLVVLVPIIALLTGCLIAPVKGPAPLRYRDEVFADVAVTSDIYYGTAIGQLDEEVTLMFDFYEPVDDPETRRPLIIWIHGGSFKTGSRTSPELVDQANIFARHGYANASISYRLSANGCSSPNAECIQAIIDSRIDAQSAVRFFRANAEGYGIDPDRIVVAGTSAGAIAALGVAYNGESPGDGDHQEFSSSVRGAVALSGASILSGAINPSDAPVLMFHGTNDSLVPYAWAKDTLRIARENGLGAYLVTYQGAGHVPYVANRAEILDLENNFFYRSLDLAHK